MIPDTLAPSWLGSLYGFAAAGRADAGGEAARALAGATDAEGAAGAEDAVDPEGTAGGAAPCSLSAPPNTKICPRRA